MKLRLYFVTLICLTMFFAYSVPSYGRSIISCVNYGTHAPKPKPKNLFKALILEKPEKTPVWQLYRRFVRQGPIRVKLSIEEVYLGGFNPKKEQYFYMNANRYGASRRLQKGEKYLISSSNVRQIGGCSHAVIDLTPLKSTDNQAWRKQYEWHLKKVSSYY